MCDNEFKRKDALKKRLNVPCLGWMQSQGPKNRNDNTDLKSPLIIWWVEGVAPSYTKRKVYYSFLDEIMSPIRTNISRGMRRDSQVIQDFKVHETNTSRYILIIPKIVEGNSRYPGRNLWQHYQVAAYIPSFIADREVFTTLLQDEKQRIDPDAKNNMEILLRIKNTRYEQALYRNTVVETCQSGDTGIDDLLAPVCTTTATLLDTPIGVMEAATGLLWSLPVFLQYVIDNTVSNFSDASLPNGLQQYAPTILSVQYLLFVEKEYSYWNDPLFHLIKKPAGSRYSIPILGMNPPVNSPPWI